MKTRTGNFPIGFRRGGGWQKDLKAVTQWAASTGFEAIDLGTLTADDAAALKSANLRIGSVDLLNMGQLLDEDAGKRKEAISANVAHVEQSAKAGAKVFFTVVLPPGNTTRKRSENYAIAVESFAPIAQAIERAGAHLAIEGWPGGAPAYQALCCTPETYRRFIKDLGGKAVGVNYDPSHLIRLGVDHIRFLREFLPHVHHVHAKDTEIKSEAVYEFGLYQPSAFSPGVRFGEHVWRYTIPGHGEARWVEILGILKTANYPGVVSVELEDADFNGSEEGEKAGFTHSLKFLAGA